MSDAIFLLHCANHCLSATDRQNHPGYLNCTAASGPKQCKKEKQPHVHLNFSYTAPCSVETANPFCPPSSRDKSLVNPDTGALVNYFIKFGNIELERCAAFFFSFLFFFNKLWKHFLFGLCFQIKMENVVLLFCLGGKTQAFTSELLLLSSWVSQ